MTGNGNSFASFHRCDRRFFLVWLLLAWLGVAMGFLPAVSLRIAGQADYPAPPILILHIISFMAWMVLLTVQLILVRTGSIRIHRRLGLVGAGLVPIMVIGGFLAEAWAQRFHLANPPDTLAFFVQPIANVAGFGILAGAAILQRHDPPAHKRLMYLGTSVILGTAYARWWGEALMERYGDGFGAFLIHAYTGTNLLVLAALGFDLATRGKVHRVLIAGASGIFAAELAVSWIYHAPWWPPLARSIVAALPGPPIP